MARIVLLDTGPLGILSQPVRGSGLPGDCAQWLASLMAAKVRIIVPEVADYEVRRELVRIQSAASVRQLDALALATEYLPITTPAMRRAADLWATARQRGRPTAGDKNIDGDMILCAQALELGKPNYVIATTNVGHLGLFCQAKLWTGITP